MSILCPSCLTDNADNEPYCVSCGFPLETDVTTTSFHQLPLKAFLKQKQYQIEQVLGEGGFGITYRGINLRNNLTVAIKELWPEKAARNGTAIVWPFSISPQQKLEQIQKFKLEAGNQQKCSHPNIAKIYDYFEENNSAYIIMEFIAGKSLYQIFKEQGKLPEEQVKHYFLQIAKALKVVHVNNFQHRDIKPDNILIDADDRAVLIDFGAAREFIAGQTKQMTAILTPGYAPLEQYSMTGRRYPGTDFYALCASMYEVLTGELPIDAIARTHNPSLDSLTPPRQLRPDLSVSIEQIILTGMKLQVEERFQTADELIAALSGQFHDPSYKKAQELVKQGKLAEAAQIYTKCLTNEPNNGDIAVELALVQIHLNDSQAEIAAQKAIKLKPNDSRGYGVLGLVKCRQANWQEAVKHLQQGANLSPQKLWIQTNLAWALGKLGNWQPAEQAINKALIIDQNSSFALGIQAWIAYNQKQYNPTTIRSATKAVFKSQQNASPVTAEIQQWVYPYLILALDKISSQDTERRIDECLHKYPDHPVILGFKGYKQANQGLWSQALPCFQQASTHPQAPAWIILNLAIIYEQLNNIGQAIQTYEAYTQKFPKNAFVYYRLGTLLGRQRQWQRAKSYLEQAIQLQSDYPEAYHNLGWVLLNLKTKDGQIENFRELLLAYRQAVTLYTQHNQSNNSQSIQQAFQIAGVGL